MNSLFSANFIAHILELRPPNSNLLDLFVWTHDPKGSFSVKGAVMKAQERRRPVRSFLDEQDWKTLWRLPLQDRLKLLLWKIAAEALPVRAPAFRSFEGEPPTELLCSGRGQHLETVLHVFSWVLCHSVSLVYFALVP